MASISKSNGKFSVRAHIGDAKTLLAFNIDRTGAKNLAGFTVQCQPTGGDAFYLLNTLQFERPGDHAQDSTEPANSSINAPYRKFRWLHVPGGGHQGTEPPYGPYTYTVTPRYFDGGKMLPMNTSLSVAITVNVAPFVKGKVSLGFTRGFTQSQAFVHHFSKDAQIAPANRDLVFDTSVDAGQNAQGRKFTFAEEYAWSGFTARDRIFDLLNGVLNDKSKTVDIFAYDLNEPDLIAILLKLAAQGRIRMILDNAPLHHPKKGAKTKSGKPAKPAWEDKFETAFKKAAKKDAEILRGHFGRYSHDKIFVVSRNDKPTTVLTGSTNFSVTGMYVNSNHVVVFDDPTVAGTYSKLFQEAWNGGATKAKFVKSAFAGKAYSFKSSGVPQTDITFSPHANDYALEVLQDLADRIAQEGKKSKADGSVLFAVMQLDGSDSTVFKALSTVHENEKIFSYGISDTQSGIKLYKPGTGKGILVTGKPTSTALPPPFDQVPNIGGVGHQVHHKFVVCGFNDDDAVVYCGSSNLASGGEQLNGDNLVAIHDTDIATAFAIEAVGLVDHFNFLDNYQNKAKTSGKVSKKKKKETIKPTDARDQAALSVKWYLLPDDKWVNSYFDTSDLHCADRLLFA